MLFLSSNVTPAPNPMAITPPTFKSEMLLLIVDELWSVLGTTNIDNRSFEHNDEVNVAMRDRALAGRLLEDYARDISDSQEIALERWRRRPFWEKVVGPFVWILERQQ